MGGLTVFRMVEPDFVCHNIAAGCGRNTIILFMEEQKMASLMAKRMARLPIGTRLEVTYGNGGQHHDKVSGILADSDFSENVVILTDDGGEVVLDIGIIRGVQPIATLAGVLATLQPGTQVVYCLGSTEEEEEYWATTVADVAIDLSLNGGDPARVAFSAAKGPVEPVLGGTVLEAGEVEITP